MAEAPRILLVATSRWAATARLADALVGAGCDVAVVCPRGHPVQRTRTTSGVYRYRVFAPLRSVDVAIRSAQPDLIIPCDDLAREQLVQLHGRAALAGKPGVGRRALLEDSLGEAASLAVSKGRSAVLTLARELGIRAPATAVAHTREALRQWAADKPWPIVLKTDGSCGGGGVRIVHSLEEAERAWLALGSPPSLGRAIKRMIVNRDMTDVLPWLRRTRPVVNMQTFVSGRDANCTVACWKGRMVASLTVLVMQTVTPRGPASVIRLTENAEIDSAASAIVRRLKLSGLVGLDFILEEATGHAYLIELNPRTPQLCHLRLGMDRDLAGSLQAILSGAPPPHPPRSIASEVIALFPQEWLRDPRSEFLRTAYHDVPWDEPDLVRACVDEVIVHRIWSGLSRQTNETKARLMARRSNAASGPREVVERV